MVFFLAVRAYRVESISFVVSVRTYTILIVLFPVAHSIDRHMVQRFRTLGFTSRLISVSERKYRLVRERCKYFSFVHGVRYSIVISHRYRVVVSTVTSEGLRLMIITIRTPFAYFGARLVEVDNFANVWPFTSDLIAICRSTLGNAVTVSIAVNCLPVANGQSIGVEKRVNLLIAT